MLLTDPIVEFHGKKRVITAPASGDRLGSERAFVGVGDSHREIEALVESREVHSQITLNRTVRTVLSIHPNLGPLLHSHLLVQLIREVLVRSKTRVKPIDDGVRGILIAESISRNDIKLAFFRLEEIDTDTNRIELTTSNPEHRI